MLPEFLAGTYDRYKADTAEFTKWLRTTAESHGFAKSEAAVKEEPSKPKGRLKGKARTKAKKAAQSKDQNTGAVAAVTVVHKVPLSRFVPLALHIAQTKPKIKVPKAVITLIRRAIALRKRCASWFRRFAGYQTRSNDRHSHFVSVLEEVSTILGIKVTITEKDSDGDARKNRFDALDVEDTVDDDDTAPQNVPQEPKPETEMDKQEVKYDLFIDHTDEKDTLNADEAIFKLFCLLSDLHNIRSYVGSIWEDYRLDKVDLMSSAVTTDTAINLARQSCTDFVEQNPDFMTNLERIIEERLPGRTQMPVSSLPAFVYFYACSVNNLDPAYKHRPQEPYNFDLADLGEAAYLNTDIMLRAICREMGKETKRLLRYNEGHFGIYDPTLNRSNQSVHKRFKDDKIIFMSNMGYFSTLSYSNESMPGEDAFTKGVKQMMVDKKVPLWLSFAAQIYLDIHACLRDQVSKAWCDMTHYATRAKNIIEGYFEWKRTVQEIPTWHKNNDPIFRGITADIWKWVETDLLGVIATGDDVSPHDERGSLLLKAHPILAGTLAFNLTLRTQEAGLTLVNVWGSMVSLAYLYDSVLSQTPLAFTWADMDAMLRFHGDEHIFFGARPTNPADSLKKLRLLAGVSPAARAALQRGGANRRMALAEYMSSRGQRTLQESTVVAHAFREYYRHGNAHSADLTVASVEKILDELAEREAAKKSGPITSSDGDSSSSKTAAKSLRRRWQKQQKLNPLQLLTAIREQLLAEEPKILLDYFGLQRRALALLKRLHAELEPQFAKYGYVGSAVDTRMLRAKHDYELSVTVINVMEVARGGAEAARAAGVHREIEAINRSGELGEDNRTVAVSKILLRAGEILMEWVDTNGRVAVEELEGLCRNRKDEDGLRAGGNTRAGLGGEEEMKVRDASLEWLRLDGIDAFADLRIKERPERDARPLMEEQEELQGPSRRYDNSGTSEDDDSGTSEDDDLSRLAFDQAIESMSLEEKMQMYRSLLSMGYR